jgi:sugar-specific transcriptional regulator TrmB
MDHPLLSQLLELHIPLNEARVYLTLLEIGQTSAGEVIKRTKLHRSVVYESLDRLIDKKLVYKLVKQNIAHFQPTDPERILQRTKSQQRVAEGLVPKLKDLIDGDSSEIIVHEGLEAYRRFWMDSVQRLPKGSIDYVAGSIGKKWQEYMGEELEEFQKIRFQREIKWKMLIFDQDEVELSWKEAAPRLHEYRLIKRRVQKDGNFNIFNDQSVILHSAKEPMIIEINNKTLVAVFKNLFDILWENGKELK